MTGPSPPLVVGISGATGTMLGVRLLELARSAGVETHVVVTPAAQQTAHLQLLARRPPPRWPSTHQRQLRKRLARRDSTARTSELASIRKPSDDDTERDDTPMRILVQATLLPGVDPTPHLAAEAARVEELMDDGSAEQFYLPADQTGAYLVINAPDLDTAHAVTQTLPMAKAGLLEFTYTELAPPSAAW